MMRTTTFAIITVILGTACAGQRADTSPAAPVSNPAESVPTVAPIPEGFFAINPQLAVEDVDAATAWYVEVLGAQKVSGLAGPDGTTYHVELKIGDSFVLLDRAGEGGMPSAKALGGSPMTLMVYVANVDEVFQGAVDAGATVGMPVDDQFWGDRYGAVTDPFGHSWAFATRVEEVSDEQMKQRFDIVQAQMAQPSDRAAVPKEGPSDASAYAWKSVPASPAPAPVPTDYHTVTMSMHAPDANAAISFYEQAFGAKLIAKMDMPNGKVMHAELEVGDTRLMISDEMPEFGTRSAATLGGSPVTIHHCVVEADEVFAKATGLGAPVAWPLADAPWGERYAIVVDPTGMPWGIATHQEDVSPEEINARMQAMMGEQTND